MKDYLKVTIMTIIGFVCALLIYPLLHEGGHVLATLLLGGKCVEFRLLPLPYMVCDAGGIGTPELVAIGMSGILLPFLLSSVMYGKNFYIWFARLILRGITVLSLLIAVSVVILRKFGIIAQGDDITEILHLWSGGTVWITSACIVLCALMIALIVRDKPIRKITTQLA